MSDTKEYRVALSVTFNVKGRPDQEPPLRVLLRETLEGAGYRMVEGAVICEAWLVAATGEVPVPFVESRGQPEPEHHGFVRHRSRGRGLIQ